MTELQQNAFNLYCTCAKAAAAKIDLAVIYVNDGALVTAASVLREAAELLDKADAAKLKALGVKP